MDEQELSNFMNKYGQMLVTSIQKNLDQMRTYAPGYDNNAYSNGRNLNYAGNAPKSPFGIGALSKSVRYEWEEDTNELSLYILDYYKYVEFGRSPGKYVPIRPLEEWARTKGLDNPRSAAFAISRNIFKFGIKPTPFFGIAVDKVADAIAVEFSDKIDEMIDTFFGALMEKSLKNAE